MLARLAWVRGISWLLTMAVVAVFSSSLAHAAADAPVASSGAEMGGGGSEFAVWWTSVVLQGVPQTLREGCVQVVAPADSSSCEAPADEATWCRCYVGKKARAFDLPSLLESAPLALAAFLGARQEVLAPLQHLAHMKEAPGGVLWRAAGDIVDNSGVAVGDVAASLPMPALELGSVAEHWLEGAYHALQEQAEAEAVALAVEHGVRALCSNSEVRTTWFVTTCAAADAGAFVSVAPEAGAASFAFLQYTLQEDVRSFVVPLSTSAVQRQPVYAAAAPGVAAALGALLQGATPANAVARLATVLGELPERTPELEALRCVSSMPAALPRWSAWVDAAQRGLAPQLDPAQHRLASFLLASLQPACAGISAPSVRARLAAWLRLHDALMANTSELHLEVPLPPEDLAGWQAAVAQTLAEVDAVARAMAVLMPTPLGMTTLQQALPAVRAYAQLATLAAAGDVSALYRGILRLGLRDVSATRLPDPVVQYGGFVMAMLRAEQPDEIKAMLLGAGATGWRTKYLARRRLVMSMSGMLGLGGHWTAHAPGRMQLIAGLGLDAVYVVCPGFNAGVFMQLLDLGGYTSFAAEGETKPRVLQALSPGLLLRFGLLGLPVLAAGGVIYDVDAGGPDARGAWRGTLGLAVDATFWMLP